MINYKVDLSYANTMALQCIAAAQAKISSVTELFEALNQAEALALPTVIIGGGSNVLLPEQLNAMVLTPTNTGIHIDERATDFRVRVEAGENWHELVTSLMQQGVHGLENLALIPGFAGASVIQNIGAYGVEVGDFVESVNVVDLATRESLTISAPDCGFAYRDSIFKQHQGRYWVDSIQLILPKHAIPNQAYPALAGLTLNTFSALYDAVMAIRRAKLPDPAEHPNCGSYFKNPLVPTEQAAQLKQLYPLMPQYASGDKTKLAAAWLIEQAGWKGRSLGALVMHSQQALVMVNNGGAGYQDVLVLERAVRATVLSQFGVELEREPVVMALRVVLSN